MEVKILESQRKTVSVDAGELGSIEITEWSNLEGWDISFDNSTGTRIIELSREEFEILTAVIFKSFENKNANTGD